MAGKYFGIPFALSGDRIAIPDAAQPDGSVSFTQGFTLDYELENTDPNYKPVPREETNALYYDITEAIGIVQKQGFADWTIAAAPYPINALVRHSDIVWRNTVAGNSAEPGTNATWANETIPATDYLNTQRIDVASASTINLTTAAPGTRHINITGTTTITAFTVAAGQCYFVRFAGALTLTNSVSLVTQSGGNITTTAGDTCIIRATAANVVEVLAYTVASFTGTGSKVFSVSPAFTGAPAAPTPAQFDNDTSLATTEFVQRALGNLSGELVVNGNITLTAADAGKIIVGNSASAFTVTLPLASTGPKGIAFKFYNSAGGVMTVQCQGADLLDGASGATSVQILQLDALNLVSNGTATWRLAGGSAELPFSQLFGKSLAANGYQKLPSGLIIQWGSLSVNTDASVAVVFPVAFPTAFLNAHATAVRSIAANNYGVFVNSTSTAGLSIVNDGSAATVYWMALGY